MKLKITKIAYLLLFTGILTFAFAQSGWIQQNSQTTENLKSVSFTDENNGWVGGGNGAILKTIDGGINWTKIPLDSTFQIESIYFTDSQTGYAACNRMYQDARILKTTDGGQSWNVLSTPVIEQELFAIHFATDSLGFAGGTLCYPANVPWATLYKTTDAGSTWTSCAITYGSGRVKDICFINQQIGWTAGYYNDYEIVALRPLLKRTVDGGITWQNCSLPNYEEVGYHAVHFYNESIGWAAGNFRSLSTPAYTGIIHKSANGGAGWDSTANSQFTPATIRDLTFTDSLNGFAVTSNGNIYNTADGGDNWIQQISTGNSSLNSICFVDSLTGWVVGKNGTIYHTTTGGWVGIESEKPSGIANIFILHPNYPNPFNPETNIRFQLPRAKNVKLEIYNLVGQKVRTLFAGNKSAGEHSLRWDGRDDAGNLVASGVYVYRLTVGKFAESKKMLLMR